MSISRTYEALLHIALNEFPDVVVWGNLLRLPSGEALKLRLHLTDDSFIEINLSPTGRYSYHWDRRLIGRSDIYRFDNAPHNAWKRVTTYPAHFHNGSEDNVEASPLDSDPAQAIRQVCSFARNTFQKEHSGL